MNLGDRLRVLRQEASLTQPELADAIGIEQSYLSKLETGKSIPSGDVLNKILDFFKLDVSDLVEGLDQRTRQQLKQIPDVSSHFDRQKQMLIGSRRRWLFTTGSLFSVGVTLIFAAYTEIFGRDAVYTYRSDGIVLEGEPREIFFLEKDSEALTGRIDWAYLQTDSYRGEVFNEPVAGGSRTYYLEIGNTVESWKNKAIGALGMLLTVMGLTGLAIEKKLSRFQ